MPLCCAFFAAGVCRLARSLLLEARGPLKVLDTFGSMLAPRLRTGQSGEPESDMADGMILQGQRLADVVAQLEAALRPAPRATQQPSLSSSSSSSDGEWVTPGQQQQQQPWREPLALPAAAMDDGNVSDEDDSWAFADGSASVQQQQQQARAAAADNCGGGPRPKLLGAGATPMPPQQQQQQQVVVADLVGRGSLPRPGSHAAESLESSSRDIRWSAVEPTTPKVVVPAALRSRSNSSSSSSSAFYVPSTVGFDAAKTIDLEAQVVTDTPSAGTAAAAAESASPWNSSSGNSRSSVSTPVQVEESGLMQLRPAAAATAADPDGQLKRQQQQVKKRPVQRGVCNVVDVLSHLLSAAAGLAQLQGVNLIINDPLSLDPPHSSTTSSSTSSSTALVLLPRPVRPLLAGVAGNVCRRVLGYCVDVALQCTPHGGQLCVTARASSGGVEVSLMHTGQAQPSRLHTSTASLDAAALGTTIDAPALAAAGGPAGSLVRRRKRKLDAAAAADSSSSSRWSTGLRELSSRSGLRGGSSLITLDFARQVLQSIGGRLSLTYPCHFINAMTGQLEVGSNIEVWLPPPAPAPTAG
jgi:hypothetical protein